MQACVAKIRSELLKEQSFPVIREHYMVTANEDSDSIIKLRKTIIREAASFKVTNWIRPLHCAGIISADSGSVPKMIADLPTSSHRSKVSLSWVSSSRKVT